MGVAVDVEEQKAEQGCTFTDLYRQSRALFMSHSDLIELDNSKVYLRHNLVPVTPGYQKDSLKENSNSKSPRELHKVLDWFTDFR